MLKHTKPMIDSNQTRNKDKVCQNNDVYDRKLSLSSTSLSSSSSDSIMITGEEISDENIVRQVWDRYTVSGSDLNRARGRGYPQNDNQLEFCAKPRSLPTNSKIHASSFSRIASTEAGGDADKASPSAPKEKAVDDVDNKVLESATFLTNSPMKEKIPFFKRLMNKFESSPGHDSKSKIFGLSRLEMLLVVIVLVVCLVLYLVLLMLTLKAASCSEMIENYVSKRQDWIEKLVKFNESVLI